MAIRLGRAPVGFLLTPLLGVGLAMAVAERAAHVRFQRVLAVITLTWTVLFVVLLLFFLLDVVQLRNAVQPEAADAFGSPATKAVITHVSFVIALGVLARSGFRMSRWTLPEPRRKPSAISSWGADRPRYGVVGA